MITIIACAIFGFLYALNSVRKVKRCGPWSSATYSFFTIITLFFGLMGCIPAIAIGGLFLPMHNVTSGPARLAALHTNDSLNGAFLLGTGSISSGVRYTYYMIDRDGSMVPESLDASPQVHIIEDASLKDTGYWSTVVREPDRKSPIIHFALIVGNDTKTLREEFRVPKGTVVQTFKVDN